MIPPFKLSFKPSILFAVPLFIALSLHAQSEAETRLVEEAKPVVTVVTAADAPELTQQAAAKLIHYIKEISGADLALVHTSPAVKTPGILWVGPHKELQERYPEIDLSVNKPEETLIKTLGKDLVILGRDLVADDGFQLEAGSNLAVSSFIEEQLGVRWLWPGEYGTVLPKTPTISLSPLEIRYAPQIQFRNTNWTTFYRKYRSLDQESKDLMESYIKRPAHRAREKDRLAREWVNHHRGDSKATGQTFTCLVGSMWSYKQAHAFSTWYKKYGEEHPEWFALQPDGTRTPFPSEQDVKMCISNPEVAEQWVQEAKAYFEKNPYATSFAAGENDHGWKGYCLCENCLAWDNKNAVTLKRPMIWANEEREGFYALTDRYAKFWNIVAKRLKEEFPNRDVNVSPYAYHVTRPAPTVPLEDNIIPAYVGVERRDFTRNTLAHTLEQREIWKAWWESVGQRNALVWRPNILIRSIGLPYIFTKRYGENVNFMAEHGLVGITFDSGVGKHWSVLGPQLYLMAKMAWTPHANAEEILADYYEKGFGPAAPYIAEYYQTFEDLYFNLIEKDYKQFGFSHLSHSHLLFRQIRLDDEPATGRLGEEGIEKHYHAEKKAEALLIKAAKAVAKSDRSYRDRVKFVKLGFDFIQAQLDTIEALKEYQKDRREETFQKALAAAERRDAALKAQAGTFAVNEIQILADFEESPSNFFPQKR